MATSKSATDYFIKLDTIDGECTKKGFEKHIEVESFSWGATQGGTHSHGTGGGSGKVDMQDLVILKKIDASSPKLLINCAKGAHLAKVVLTARKAGGGQQVFLTYTLSGNLVSSYKILGGHGLLGGNDWSGDGGGADDLTVPTEKITIAFTKIEMAYKPQKADGSMDAAVTAGWDQSLAQPV
jgi:type VI secretion system secreted protein Hcp